MIFYFFIVCLSAAFLPAVHLQDYKDFQDPCPISSCNPQLGDLLVGRAAQLSASSTCGLDGPQNYCIIGYLEEGQKCFTCDSRLPYHRYNSPNSHRIENVITNFDLERKLKWWQSETGVHNVSIQLNLETMFQFSHLVLRFKSFRPAAMLVERSRDFGRSWTVVRYFAEDCSLHFPSVSTAPTRSIDDVVCDSRYSGSESSLGGEVVLKALDPVFKTENPHAPNIHDLTTVTNIRVNFTRLFTLGDTLLSRKRRNPQDKYYYSVYNMVVQGSCFCNGHASQCVPMAGVHGDVFTQPGMVHRQCVCKHNTAGENCERCQDFHNDSPWKPGGEGAADICRACNCHNHSDSCHFDAARYEATGGVSGGVCDDCGNNRMGPQCEQCQPFLYQDPQRAKDDPQACIPCNCDPAGSRGGGQCDALSGQCVCKENVEGQRCDRCKHGFFSLRQDDPTGCQACRCHPLGSVGSCDQLTGTCECHPMASGPLCDRCLPDFWGLGNSVFRCSPCNCDIGGAHSSTCSPEDGQCRCLPNMIGRRCSDPAPGYFLPPLNYFLYEAELTFPLLGGRSSTTPPPSPSSFAGPSSSSLLNPGVLPQCEQYFKKQGFDTKFQNGRVILVRRARQLAQQQKMRKRLQTSIPLVPGYTLQIIHRQRASHQPVTWTGLGLVRVFEGVGLRFTVDNLPSSTDYQLAISYEPESASDWMAIVSIGKVSPGDGGCSSNPTGSKTVILPGNSRRGILDSLLCLNAGGQYFVDVTFYKQPRSDSSHILIDSISLFNRIGSVQNFCSQSDLDTFHQFPCTGLAVKPGPQESLPEVCEGLIVSLSAQIHNGAVLCRCNVIGSTGPSCSKLGGFCDCKANVIGRCCDACAPMTFGFGPEGCKQCNCDPHGSVSELCDQVSGQCACRSEITGQRCKRCQMGFWGFPSCRSCECNGLSEVCDGFTGDCLNCREHTTGPSCERCVEGYYGDPISRQACQPCLCPDVLSSGRFFATSCQHDPQSLRLICKCQEGHTGVSCDSCSPGFYGDLTLPGAVCKECPCNNNIDPDDPNSCNSTTGECLHCLHNTIGLHCQHCKPGYHGNALTQDCKECSCDRRGTQETRCPLGRPCFCDPRTGQCPCRTGVIGKLCDECEDRYWNLNIASGCQPCSCDLIKSISNICDKVTGHCPCHPEFGGRHCDECRENHFRNPDLQCISCDCNLEGTKQPSRDPETGKCICRAGVSGVFCDECTPGFNTLFSACEPCHPCNALWTQIVTDVQRAAQKMRTLIPHNNVQPTDNQHLQEMINMHSMLDSLANLRVISPPSVEKLEKMSLKVRKVKDAIDTNVILIDMSPLFNTEIDDIHLEIMNLKKKLTSVPTDNVNDQRKARVSSEPVVELLDEIQTLYRFFMLEDERVGNVSKAVEDSMDTRQEVKHKLSMCNTGDLALLKKKVTELSVVQLKQKVCGDPGLEDCSGCTGALCGRDLGKRKCGSLNCKGAVPVSEDASKTAEKLKDQLVNLPSRLQDTKNKINNANEMTWDAKNWARDLQDQINNNTNSCVREKNKIRELIQQVKDYLMDDMVPPKDTEKMAQAVLRIELPQSPANIQSMINNVNILLKNATRFLEDLKNLDKQAKAAIDLQQEALELKEQMENTDVKKIIQDIYEADKAQAKANNLLERASRNKDETKDRIRDAEDTLDNIEERLMIQTKDLQKEIEAMKDKTEENRETAREAREVAESALNMTTDAETELSDVTKQFEVLKQNQQNQEVKGQAAGRLKNIMMEAEDMKRQVEDKLQQIQDMEQKIQQLLHRRNQKAAEVSDLLETAESIRQEISTQVYTECTG
ncbi:laminin subunit beta-4 isoform X2 [Simochromis diagramma]|uniref:laminin subunit beta-4 isoform X2 n=1 Tax=Simochromis diagramma TaxID=43689 RepID=UPI001A7E9EEE|nr:laminin subunit beta-4 isoform X2 [Simochromis diagramma]